jgi:hypothetical protein
VVGSVQPVKEMIEHKVSRSEGSGKMECINEKEKSATNVVLS